MLLVKSEAERLRAVVDKCDDPAFISMSPTRPAGQAGVTLPEPQGQMIA